MLFLNKMERGIFMATILNICNDVRKRIKDIDEKIDQAVYVWDVSKDKRTVAVLSIDKAEEIKGDVKELMGKLEVIDKQLEKDSSVREYYNSVYKKCADFWNKI